MTTRLDTAPITQDRLEDWRELLAKHDATPVLLVGVGHNERSGVVNVIVTEDCSTLELRAWLAAALRELGGGTW